MFTKRVPVPLATRSQSAYPLHTSGATTSSALRDTSLARSGAKSESRLPVHQELASREALIRFSLDHKKPHEDHMISLAGQALLSSKELLGSGGQGTVYRTTLPTTPPQTVVVKVFHSHSDENGVYEAACLRVLNSRLWNSENNTVQGVPTYIASGEIPAHIHPEQPFIIIMNDCGSPLTVTDLTRHKVRSLLELIITLHEKGVTHRDIKVGNLLSNAIIDFGMSSINLDPHKETGPGTAGFCPPPDSQFNIVSDDLFSFAIAIFKLLLNRDTATLYKRPSQDKNPSPEEGAKLYGVMSQFPRESANVSAELDFETNLRHLSGLESSTPPINGLWFYLNFMLNIEERTRLVPRERALLDIFDQLFPEDDRYTACVAQLRQTHMRHKASELGGSGLRVLAEESRSGSASSPSSQPSNSWTGTCESADT